MAQDDQYNQIFQLWRNERRSTQLLEVKGSLYSKIRQKISDLTKELEKIDKQDKASINVLEERIERLNKILRDLTKLRVHKIIHNILNETLTKEGLAAEELDLVSSLERIFDEHNRRSILGEAIIDRSREKSSLDSKDITDEFDFMTVRILRDVPEIVDATAAKGSESNTIGPFKKEDIVRLPLIYAKTLIMKNAADRVDLPNL
ncbi:MAG: DNA replication complex GINS family protein [Asgard group archaeon]|nr:DNA replication complex GINS family protein [Asgard group archaeon]